VLGNGGSKTELEPIKEKIVGNLLMVHSGETKEGWLHRRIKYTNAEQFGAKCFIFSNHNPGQLFPTGSVKSNKIGRIPAVGISKESFEYIKTHLGLGKKVKARIKVKNEYTQSTSKHIIWEIEGEKKDEVVIIGGHYDGHDIAQGAKDNAASIGILLELTRLMVKYNLVPKRTIKFIAFGVEEFGVVGSTIYTENEDLHNVMAMINLDGLVDFLYLNIACNGNVELCSLLENLKEDFIIDAEVTDTIITASDNYPFFCKGIPSLCIYGVNPDPRAGRGYGHTSADTFDKISRLDTKISLAFLIHFLTLFLDLETLPCRMKEVEIIQILKKANLEQKLKLLEKWPFTEK